MLLAGGGSIQGDEIRTHVLFVNAKRALGAAGGGSKARAAAHVKQPTVAWSVWRRAQRPLLARASGSRRLESGSCGYRLPLEAGPVASLLPPVSEPCALPWLHRGGRGSWSMQGEGVSSKEKPGQRTPMIKYIHGLSRDTQIISITI